jgi:hypothetical protein
MLYPPVQDRRVSLARIDAVVAMHLGPARVTGNAQPAAFNRQLAMYLAKHVGRRSTTRIGKFYNGRDHSTVCHSIRKIEALKNGDPEIAQLLQTLTERVLETTTEATKPDGERSVGQRTFEGLSAEDEWFDLLADKIVELSHDRLFSRVLMDRHQGMTPRSDRNL